MIGRSAAGVRRAGCRAPWVSILRPGIETWDFDEPYLRPKPLGFMGATTGKSV